MDIPRIVLSGVIGGVVAYLVVRALRRDAGGAADTEDLHYGPGMKITALALLLIAGFIGYAALQARPSQRLIAFTLSALLLAGAGWFVLEAFFTRIRFGEDAIAVYSPWRRFRKVPYSAITGYRYSEANQWHVLETPDGNVRLSIYLRGIDRFGELLGEKLRREGRAPTSER